MEDGLSPGPENHDLVLAAPAILVMNGTVFPVGLATCNVAATHPHHVRWSAGCQMLNAHHGSDMPRHERQACIDMFENCRLDLVRLASVAATALQTSNRLKGLQGGYWQELNSNRPLEHAADAIDPGIDGGPAKTQTSKFILDSSKG